MKKLYCLICGTYGKFEKSKLSYLLKKRLVLSIFFSKSKNEDERLFKEDISVEILNIPD